jgi:hypothetical protein
MGYAESRDLLDVAGAAATVPTRDLYHHVIVLDGQVIGRWRNRRAPGVFALDVQLLTPLDAAARRSVDEAVERAGAFFRLPASWRVVEGPGAAA